MGGLGEAVGESVVVSRKRRRTKRGRRRRRRVTAGAGMHRGVFQGGDRGQQRA